MLKEKLSQLLKENDLSLTDEQIDSLIHYIYLLNKWNSVYNLTAVKDPEEMLSKHIIDSLVMWPYLNGMRFIDVGTGPGLPGIPLAIVNPDKRFTLADSLGKRIRFLNQVKLELNLVNVEPIQTRIEVLTTRQFDGIISRAFASLQDMLNLTHQLVTPGGKFYALKGRYPDEELAKLPKNFYVEDIIQFSIPSMQAERHLVIIGKL